MKRIVFLMILISALIGTRLINCAKSPTKPANPTARSATRSGWRYYQRESYSRAIKKFNEAKQIDTQYFPAYNGLIWSYLAVDSLDKAISSAQLVTVMTIDSIELKREIHAGAILAFTFADSFSKVIQLFKPTQINWNDFAFEYNDEIDVDDIRWALATAYFYTQNYELAAQQIKLVMPNWQYDSNAPDFIPQIMAALDAIGQSVR